MSSLFLAPHNDDETLFGAFSLLRHRPLVVVCLRSFRMFDANYPGGMPIHFTRRELETDAAMRTLGCQWLQWKHPDDKPDWDMVHSAVEGLRDGRIEWEHVFAPAWEEAGNEHHNYLAQIADDVFGRDITRYLTYTANGKSEWGTEIEVEPEWPARKLLAMSCYESQAAHPATCKHFIDHSIREFVA